MRQFENDTVIPLTPWLVNTFLVRGDRPILVDTGFPADESAIRAALTAQNVQMEELALIFVTHGHYDHFGSAAALKTDADTPISIHALEADRLRSGVSPHVEVLSATGRLLGILPAGEQPPVPVAPTVFFADGDRLDGYGVAAKVIHTPGHSDGSLSLLVNELAIIGDLLAGSLLYSDQPDYPFFIEDPAEVPLILASVERLLDEGAAVFYPGHGLPFSRAVLERWLDVQT